MPTITDLGALVKQRHPGVYDDLADDVLGRKVKLKYPGEYDDFTGKLPVKDRTRKRQEILAGRAQAESEAAGAGADAWRGVLNTLPQVGGAAGSLLGPLGAGAGAGLGELGVQVGKAGAGEGFDLGQVGKAATGATAGAYAGLGVGKLLGKAGGVITGSLRQRAVQKATEAYARATQAGVTEPTIALTQGIPRLLQRAGRAGQAEVEHVLAKVRNFLANKGPDQTPLDLQEIRRVADEIAAPYYNKVGRFLKPPDPAVAAEARVYKLIADNAREALRRLVPEATKHEATASRLINARRMIPVGSQAVPTSFGSFGNRTGLGGVLGFAAGGPPGAAAGALANAVLTAPQAQMMLGRGLESPLLQALLAQLGRGVGTEVMR